MRTWWKRLVPAASLFFAALAINENGKKRTYLKPYWATEGPGNTCWMSMSGSDLVTVISFAEEKVVAEVPVGDHPQRVREGEIRESVIRRF